MSALAAVNATPALAAFSPTSRAILAIALEGGRPLRAVTRERDREILLRAEHLVRRERVLGRRALERARTEELSLATLRGILRFARALVETDDVVVPVRELTRREVVDEAFRLFARPPLPLVEITVEAIKAAFPGAVELTGAVELDEPADPLGEEWGPALGACARCGDVVRAGSVGHPLTLAVLWKGKARTSWRLVARTDVTPKTGKPTALAKMLLSGEAPLLCHACPTRLSAKLIVQARGSAELVPTSEPEGGAGAYFAPHLDRERDELELEQVAPTLVVARGIVVKPRPRRPEDEGDRRDGRKRDFKADLESEIDGLRRAVLEHAQEAGQPLDVDDPWDEAIVHRATLLAIAHPVHEALARARAATYLMCPTCEGSRGRSVPVSARFGSLPVGTRR